MGRFVFSDDRGFSLTELLVAIVILGILGTTITSVVLASYRAEQYQAGLQEVVDDGRTSLSRIRKELRSARRLHASACATDAVNVDPDDAANDCAPSDRLHFWVDINQDSIVQADEQICYIVAPVDPSESPPTRWELLRWSGAELASDCALASGSPPSGFSVSILAQTLVLSSAEVATGYTHPHPFTHFTPTPSADPNDAATRSISMAFELEVASARGPDSISVDMTVRLRNVE